MIPLITRVLPEPKEQVKNGADWLCARDSVHFLSLGDPMCGESSLSYGNGCVSGNLVFTLDPLGPSYLLST